MTNILILIDTSWGEIEWILPVCRYIKLNHPEVNINALFNTLDYRDITRDNNILYKMLEENVDACYDFRDFLPIYLQPVCKLMYKMYDKFKRLRPFIKRYGFGGLKLASIRSIGKKLKPDVLLKDTAPDILIRKKLVNLFNCREVMYPHGSLINKYPRFPEKEKRPELQADDILCNTKWMENIFENNTHVVGVPKYDRWWIEYQQDFYDTNNPIRVPNKKTFLVFGVTNQIDKMVSDIFSSILPIKDSFIIVKPHPKQNLDELKDILNKYDNDKWIIDNSQAVHSAKYSDVIICMAVSCIVLDVLALDKVAIEYRPIGFDIYHEYSKLGLVLVANGTNELKNILNGIYQSKQYVNNFRKLCPRSYNDATRKATSVILSEKYE